MAQSHVQIKLKGIVCPELMDGQNRLFIVLGTNIAYTGPEISEPPVSYPNNPFFNHIVPRRLFFAALQ